MVLTSRQKHQKKPLSLNLSLNGTDIKQVSKHRLLGVTVDDRLEWKPHVAEVCKKVSKNLFMLSKLRYITDAETRMIFYNAHIKSHIDYASTVWDGGYEDNLRRLNSLHRRAAKLISIDTQMSTDDKLKQLSMLPLSYHLQFNKGILMYKVNKQSTPDYMNHMFSKASSRRSRSGSLLNVPYPRIELYKRSLLYSGSSLWNSLPPQIKNAPSISSFKKSLFSYLNRLC